MRVTLLFALMTIPLAVYAVGAHEAAASTQDRGSDQARLDQGKSGHHPHRHHRAQPHHARRHHGGEVGRTRRAPRAATVLPGDGARPGKARHATAKVHWKQANPGASVHRLSPKGADRADRTAQGKTWRLAFRGAHAARRARGHAAGDPPDTISDFKFTPGTLTIHAGDTITWTNDGPSDHTATANDGSFNTGTLKKGQSASHTFTKAGTFAFICAIHPFMKGTIVVQASTSSATGPSTTAPSTTSPSVSGSGSTGSGNGASGSSGTTPSTSSTGTTPGASSSSSDPTLPITGFDLPAAVLCGLGLMGLGLVLRTRVREDPPRVSRNP
jgi:plastocyanin